MAGARRSRSFLSPYPPLPGETLFQTGCSAAAAGPSAPAGSCRVCTAGASAASGADQRPAASFGLVSVGARQSRSLRSTWTDGRSRRLSVPATSRSDSDPNGLPGSHRGTSRTHRKLPHVHGRSLGSLGRGPLFGARRSGFDGPMQRPPVSLSQGAGGPSRQLCAWSTLWGGLEPGGVVGGRLGAPSGAPVCASRPDVVSVLPHHSFNVVGGTDLKSRRYETRNDFDF